MNLDTCTPGQRRIITTLDKPLMVSAGAGSGKTFTLTQRIAYALTEPVCSVLDRSNRTSSADTVEEPSSSHSGAPFAQNIDEVLAITFTKKAAAELKSRIKSKLLELGLTSQALKVDDAWISTIHGMCSRILREHSLELGIDPNFQVLSDTEANRLKEQAFDQVIFEINQSNNTSLKDYIHSVGIVSYGANGSSIQDYVTTLTNKVLAVPNGFDSLQLPPIEGNPSEILRQMIELGQQFVEISSTLSKPTKTDAKHLEACESALNRAQTYLENGVATSFDEPSLNSSFASVFFAFPKTSPKYRVKESDPAFFAQYRQTYAELACKVEAAFAAKEQRNIVAIAKRVYEVFQELKKPAYLDNTDLLRLTYQALKTHPNIASSYRDQFRLIMIDEFQDTDELQVAIFSQIAQSGFTNVCTVGDAQQSIYRFRGADVGVFYSYQSMLASSSNESVFVNLPDNFRSHADVLSFVDAIFSQAHVFGERFLSLQPKGKVNDQLDEAFENRSRISAALYDCPTEGPGVSGGRVACARRIAQHFAELHDAGVSPSDMTLLLGSMSNVDIYAQALRDFGFQSLVSGGSTFSAAYEVDLIKSLTSYFANPLNDAALYQVLSSPLFAIDDDSLLYMATQFDREGKPHRRALSAGFVSWERERGLSCLSDGEKDSLDFAHGTLKAAREMVARGGLAAGVLEACRASGWFIRLDSQGDAEAQAIVGNVYKALRMIEEIEKLGLGLERSVQQFIDDCETLKIAPGSLSNESGNFIKIMTIHASKGLEFPHVAVAELRLDSWTGSFLVENISGKTFGYVKPKELESFRPLIKSLKEYLEPMEGTAEEVLNASSQFQPRALEACIAAQELSEARRLLYVALTRASKSLFVGIAYRGKKEPDYTNKGILEDLYTALHWQASASAPRQYIDYGGSAPMCLEFNVVDNAFEENHPLESYFSFDLNDCRFSKSNTTDEFVGSPKDFLIPGFPPQPALFAEPVSWSHSEVCSYSSLGSSEHAQTTETNDPCYQGVNPLLQSSEPVAFDAGDNQFSVSLSTEDDATALGSAFHRLAQRAIDESTEGKLQVPSSIVVQSQCSTYSLSTQQQARLHCALDLWFASDCAHKFASYPYRYAEVPFMVSFGVDNAQFLEGEIDGLACDFPYEEVLNQPEDTRKAYLIDYKTGCSPLEVPQEIYHKHLLQARCYAFALLKQGFTSIKACFVRVEQEDPMHPRQPQIQEYEFESSQLSYLESMIYQRYLA